MALPAPGPSSTALVTGASSGIGTAYARALAARGHGVVLVARREERLKALADELAAETGVAAHAIGCDLADASARDGLVGGIAELGLTVEILVNNAGFGVYGAFVDSERERELQQVRLDVEAVVDLTKRYFPAMCQAGRGTVINMSSTAGLQPLPFNSTYAASKSFVLLFSEALWSEGKDHGVTVTAVCPGPVKTEFQEANDARFADKLPGMVWVAPEEVAEKALRAAEKGKRTIIPGLGARAAFGPNRFMPAGVALPVAKRLMRN
ncbi:MAG: SDR family oxidoreductase [Actinobacteria bacterium]|nr:MAG: SDR family oxidoreductase [Actinomycetota bacterium]